MEPLTNYFVGRLQQDFRGGDTQIGVMLTSVHRDIDGDSIAFLPREAYAGGVDFAHYLSDRDYRIEANLLASQLRGGEEAIDEAQTSSARYFQRPDNDHVDYDPDPHHRSAATRARCASRAPTTTPSSSRPARPGARPASRSTTWASCAGPTRSTISPGSATASATPSGSFATSASTTTSGSTGTSAASSSPRPPTSTPTPGSRTTTAPGVGVTREAEYLSNIHLRGGPSSKWPGNWAFDVYAISDERRKLQLGAGYYTRHGDEGSEDHREAWMDLVFRPTNALRLTASPICLALPSGDAVRGNGRRSATRSATCSPTWTSGP